MFKLSSLDDMICQSIMSISNVEMRKKLANSILLVGGGVKYKGIIDFLEDRLIDKLTVLDNEIDRVEIINFPTIDAKILTWIGGTILPKLDSSKDMWISRERWLAEYDKSTIEEQKEKEKEKEKLEKDNISVANENESIRNEKPEKRKKEKNIEGGVKLIREKCPFQWY